MIKAKELQPSGKTGYRMGGELAQTITIPLLKEVIEQVNEEKYGLPISVRIEPITSGGLFNSTTEDSVFIVNTEKTGYFGYVLMLRKQGKFATVKSYYYGYSALTEKMERTQNRSGLGGLVLNALNGVNEQAYNEEYEYYALLDNLFEEVCG